MAASERAEAEKAQPAGDAGAADLEAAAADLDPRFVREVLRINERYLREVIEAFNICPFARRGRERRQIVREVLGQRGSALAPSLALLAAGRGRRAG